MALNSTVSPTLLGSQPHDIVHFPQLPEKQSAADDSSGGPTRRRPRLSSSQSSKSKSYCSRIEFIDEDFVVESSNARSCGRGGSCCTGDSIAYWCYLMIFLSFLLVFPFFVKWLLAAPIPQELWNKNFPHFPLIEDWRYVQDRKIQEMHIMSSEIPQSLGSCDHTCGTGGGFLRPSGDMRFGIDVELEAPRFGHTVYPVMLVSNDWDNWWVGGSRTDAQPQAYFAKATSVDGDEYRHVTPTCMKPPALQSSGSDHYVDNHKHSAATYLMVCVTWTIEKVQRHHSVSSIAGEDLGLYCDTVGGVGGWPCGSDPDSIDLPGCTDGVLDVSIDAQRGQSVVAGQTVDASFQGKVQLRACLNGSSTSETCVPSELPFSRWNCHTCRNITNVPGAQLELLNQTSLPKMEVMYNSLPSMEIVLSEANPKRFGSAANDRNGDLVKPYAYVFTSTLSDISPGPAGMHEGKWERLYDLDMTPGPEPADAPRRENPLSTTPIPIYDAERSTMQLRQGNKLRIEPSGCIGKPGPLYVAVCAVNSSTHADKFEFVPGQRVPPPPFNDRCLAVSGRCAYACGADRQLQLKHCENGQITQTELDGTDRGIDTRKNDVHTAVHIFVILLLCGFSAKLLQYTPGLFVPFRAAKSYNEKQTSQLKYIAVCTPSGSESKACVLRSLVGSVSARPKGCKCPFHVVLADEGHRHPIKIMFRLLVSILEKVPNLHDVPEVRKNQDDNIKDFTSQWVLDTRKFILNDCKTAEIQKDLNKLPADSDDAKNLTAKLDALSGITALRTMQNKKGWPKCRVEPHGAEFAEPKQAHGAEIADLEQQRSAEIAEIEQQHSAQIAKLEQLLQQMKSELTIGEEEVVCSGILHGHGHDDHPTPACEDDCESFCCPQHFEHPRFHLHYLGRAKPDENEMVIKVQHVARGMWCYMLPTGLLTGKLDLQGKSVLDFWLDLRKKATEYCQDFTNRLLVPLRTSRGKAGGLNFAENYLFAYSLNLISPQPAQDGQDEVSAWPELTQQKNCDKCSLFSVADARHQFQSDFFTVTLPYFFSRTLDDDRLNTKVSFAQCPQYFPEMPDDKDILDTSNSHFFRLSCMLRNSCGGVSSCGTNGTWLIPRRCDSEEGVWDLDSHEETNQGFTQLKEFRFFHESCKVEDTASSHDRVVQGRHSQYIHQCLSYGMAKNPKDYLAAVQRWAEGGVVLSLQTLTDLRKQGVFQIWCALLIYSAFVCSLFFLAYGVVIRSTFHNIFSLCTDHDVMGQVKLLVTWAVNKALVAKVDNFQQEWAQDYVEMFFDTLLWFLGLLLCVSLLWLVTKISFCIHHCVAKKGQPTYFPTSMSQWGRLLIVVNNLTYFFWFWTAFFWIGYNFACVFKKQEHSFDPVQMTVLAWTLQVLSWSMVIFSCSRYQIREGIDSNEVFSLTLTNIWRTTQMYYMTAPLVLYSIIMGIRDFLRNRSFGEDISYWTNGDRGETSKTIVKYWTLLLILLSLVAWGCNFAGILPNGSASGAAVIVVSLIGLDVLLPCAYLWLGNKMEKIPEALRLDDDLSKGGVCVKLQKVCGHCCQKLTCLAWWRNNLRSIIFSTTTTSVLKWVGPIQQLGFPLLTWFFPTLGINVAIMAAIAGRT
jgi:hypothetical protein